MNKTNDFKYNLPAYSDPVDIEDLNDNFRGIDDALMAGLCKKDYTGNNMGSSDPSARKYAWAPWLEIVNDNEFDVVVTDRNAPVGSEEATINIAAGQTFRKYINGRYYMNFYVQDQYDVTFKWFTNAETYINESGGGGGGTGTVTSVSVQGGSGSHLTGSGNPIETSGTITINVDEGYSIPSDNEQTAWDGKAADLKAEIDSSTYVLTLQLKDSSGNLIGNERTIDLPLETMVVDGEYDPQTKKIKLELKNGNYVEFSVADLVSGLQTELNSNNKLNPEYIAYDASHRAVSDTEKGTWNAKQNAISDLETIRSGASAGATAVQPSAMQTALSTKQDSLDSTQLAAVNSGINSTKVAQISTNQSNILYGMKTGVKNIIYMPDGVYSPSSRTKFTVVDGAVTCETTASYTDAVYLPDFVIPAGTYRILGTANDTGFQIRLYDTNNTRIDSDPFILNTDTTVRVAFYSLGDAASGTLTPMICLESIYNQDSSYAKPALPNYDLTRLEAEDRASLAEVVDSGAKNLLQLPSTATMVGNVTATISGNEVTVTRTSSSNSAAVEFELNIPIPTNKWVILSGCPANGSSDTYMVDAYDNNTQIGDSVDLGNGSKAFKFSTTTQKVRIRFAANTSYTNLKFQLMVCTKAAFGVSSKFVPYRPNWDLVSASVPQTSYVVNHNVTTSNVYELVNNLYIDVPTGKRVFIAVGAKKSNPIGIAICDNNTYAENRVIIQNEISNAQGMISATGIYDNGDVSTTTRLYVFMKSKTAMAIQSRITLSWWYI